MSPLPVPLPTRSRGRALKAANRRTSNRSALCDWRIRVEPSCGCVQIDPHTIRITIAGRPGIVAGISAAALTITATGGSTPGFVTVFPSGQPRPATSTLNVAAGADASNSTDHPSRRDGMPSMFASTDASLIVDITGSFLPSDTATSGRYLPTPGARLLDTRNSMVLGIAPGSSVTLPLPSGVDAGARGVVVNVTSVGAVRRGFLTGYAAGSAAPATSFMNPNGSGAAIAASVILPVSASGLTIASSAGGHVIVDLVGWFTGDSAPSSSTGLLVAVAPTRLLDTRTDLPRLWPKRRARGAVTLRVCRRARHQCDVGRTRTAQASSPPFRPARPCRRHRRSTPHTATRRHPTSPSRRSRGGELPTTRTGVRT